MAAYTVSANDVPNNSRRETAANPSRPFTSPQKIDRLTFISEPANLDNKTHN